MQRGRGCHTAPAFIHGTGVDRRRGTTRRCACGALGTYKATEAENARIRLGFSRGLLFLLAFEFLYILYRSGPTVLREKIGLFSVRVANSFKKILLTVKQK